MSLNLDKSTWKRVRLGEVIRRSRRQVDPVSSGVDRYVAGGHVDSQGVTIERWGQVGDGQMGSTFRYVFQPGQVLFVSARPYLRKVGVPDFSGVVADKTYVLDAIPENGLLQEFLPFLLSSEAFVEYGTAEATGSMNPRLLWGPMQRYEFDLPPLDEQKRLADLLWAVERHRQALVARSEALGTVPARLLDEVLASVGRLRPLSGLVAAIVDCAHKTAPTGEGGSARVIGTRDIRNGKILVESARPVSEATFLAWTERAVPQPGDLIFAREAPVGEVGIVSEGQRLCLGQRTVLIRPRDASDSFLLWVVLRSSGVQSVITSKAAGSTVPHLNVGDIRNLEVPWPEDEIASGRVRDLALCGQAASDAAAYEIACIDSHMRALSATIFGG
ncbi:restriction endonuclease subunit S [Micromonospora sp. WMMC415]|uniref:restriction endonuclease subunit S n=1 Tax=Micromonospora sp. WMMC415 TaxID=2675222 RepID=UPI0018AF6070|nr:restriction endonuclease subunit S [Micromonospora sp. WMMC415]